jgi:hypothetical protein
MLQNVNIRLKNDIARFFSDPKQTILFVFRLFSSAVSCGFSGGMFLSASKR